MAARPRQAKRRNWPANLNQNGAGYFYWRDPDSKKDYGLGRDQAKAFQEARAANAEVARRTPHTSLVDRINKPAGRSLHAWTVEYLATFEKERQPAASTLRSLKSLIGSIQAAPFSAKQLQDVQTKEIVEFLAAESTARGAPTTKLIRRTLNDLYREAEMAGLIGRGQNPVTVTKAPKVEVSRSRLTLDQFKAIHLLALEQQPWIARAMELAIVTGQRRDDITRMLFADVKDGFLCVSQGKTGIKLRIPVALRLDALGKSLDEIIRNCRDQVVSKWMLHHVESVGTAKPGNGLQAARLSKAFAAVRDKAEIEWEAGKTPATFHEIRSLSARLYTDQYSKDFAQAILGHKSAEMTAIYRDVRGAEWIDVKLTG